MFKLLLLTRDWHTIEDLCTDISYAHNMTYHWWATSWTYGITPSDHIISMFKKLEFWMVYSIARSFDDIILDAECWSGK